MNFAMKLTTVGSSRNCHNNMTTFSIGTRSLAPSPNTSSTNLQKEKAIKEKRRKEAQKS